MSATTLSQPVSIPPIVSTTDPLKALLLNVYFLYQCFSLIVGIGLITRFFWLSRRKRTQLSRQFQIHLIMWLICMCCTTVFIWPTLIAKVLPFLAYTNDLTLFNALKGSFHLASAQTIPLSTMFLLIDRIESMLFVSVNVSRRKLYTQYISVFTLMNSFCITFVLFFYRGYLRDDARQNCNFGCRITDTVDDLLTIKMSTSCVNIFIGLYFVYLYFRYSRKLTIRNEKKRNYTAFVMFVTEFFCTILPTSLYLVFRNELLPYVYLTASTGMTMGYCTDGLVTAIVYWKTRHRATVQPLTNKWTGKPLNKSLATIMS